MELFIEDWFTSIPLENPTITTIHDPNNQNAKVFASFTWKRPDVCLSNNYYSRSGSGLPLRRSFGQPMLTPHVPARSGAE